MRSELLTEKYGLITDCLAELTRELRKKDCTHLLDSYFRLNNKFNKRDEIAVRKTMSGLIKLIFPDENVTEEEMRRQLEYAIEGRRRVKEQLKLMAGVEFANVALGYVDEYGSETVVSVPEQASNTLIPAEKLPAGHVFALGASEDDGEVVVYRLENKVIRGNGKMERQGISGSRAVNECIDAASLSQPVSRGQMHTRHKVKWIPFFELLLFTVITAEWGVSNDNKRCESGIPSRIFLYFAAFCKRARVHPALIRTAP